MGGQILKQLDEDVCINLFLRIQHIFQNGVSFLIILNLSCYSSEQLGDPRWRRDILVQCRITPNSLAMEKITTESR